MMIKLDSRWAFQITGSQVDIRNLGDKLSNSVVDKTDYFMDEVGECWCLRTSRWDHLEITEAKSLAFSKILMIRGCLHSLDGCGILKDRNGF